MRHALTRLALSLAATLFGTSAAGAQLALRVARVLDGTIRMSFPVRPEVCGDGRFIGEDTPRGFRMYTFSGDSYSIETLEDVEPDCRQGPLRLVVVKAGGQFAELRAAVGVGWRPNDQATDLGEVSAPEAAAWLLDLAPNATQDRVLTTALLAANAALGAEVADRLFSLARDGTLRAETRARVLRWLSEAGRREGKAAQADDLLRALAQDGAEVASVRERAVRELEVTPRNLAFLESLYGRVAERPLKARIVRRIGESRTVESAAWVRRLALDPTEARDLRDRALRALAQQLDRRAEVRDLFGKLEDPELKARALQLVAEAGDSTSVRWLRLVALDDSEPLAARDRAFRILAEQGTTSAELAAFYDRVSSVTLRRRLLRILSERGDEAARSFLQQRIER